MTQFHMAANFRRKSGNEEPSPSAPVLRDSVNFQPALTTNLPLTQIRVAEIHRNKLEFLNRMIRSSPWFSELFWGCKTWIGEGYRKGNLSNFTFVRKRYRGTITHRQGKGNDEIRCIVLVKCASWNVVECSTVHNLIY